MFASYPGPIQETGQRALVHRSPPDSTARRHSPAPLPPVRGEVWQGGVQVGKAESGLARWSKAEKCDKGVTGTATRGKVLGRQDQPLVQATGAEREMGVLLKEMAKKGERDPGHRKKLGSKKELNPPTLRDLHLTKKESLKARRLAEMPVDDFARSIDQGFEHLLFTLL